MTLRRAFAVGAVATAMYSASAFGLNERLSFSQATDGTVAVTLDGQTPYCGDTVGPPVVTVSATAITLVSHIQVGECPNPPPGFAAIASRPGG